MARPRRWGCRGASSEIIPWNGGNARTVWHQAEGLRSPCGPGWIHLLLVAILRLAMTSPSSHGDGDPEGPDGRRGGGDGIRLAREGTAFTRRQAFSIASPPQELRGGDLRARFHRWTADWLPSSSLRRHDPRHLLHHGGVSGAWPRRRISGRTL